MWSVNVCETLFCEILTFFTCKVLVILNINENRMGYASLIFF